MSLQTLRKPPLFDSEVGGRGHRCAKAASDGRGDRALGRRSGTNGSYASRRESPRRPASWLSVAGARKLGDSKEAKQKQTSIRWRREMILRAKSPDVWRCWSLHAAMSSTERA